MEPCGHSLHKDHYQYFAYANMVASFKYVSLFYFGKYKSLLTTQIHMAVETIPVV